jgi:hypothetical protein
MLQLIRARHADMEEILSSLDRQQMTAPVLDDGWSVKDSLAHLADGESLLTGWVAAYRRGETPVFWAPGFEAADEDDTMQMDRYNAYVYEKYKDLPLEEVLEEFREAFLRTVELVSSLSESELFDPDYFPQRKGRALIPLIAGDSYEHYGEHIGWIRRWLERQ